MDSFLIISKPITKAREYAEEFCKKNKIDRTDITFIESEKSVGISVVREFQKKIYLKPFKSDKKTVILSAENGITAEAQNALLKILEEPPVNTVIFLLVQSLENVLPTIISRCKVVILNDEIEKDFKQYLKLLSGIGEKTAGEKLKIAQDYSKDKDTALQFLEGMIFASEQILKNPEGASTVKNVRLLQKTYGEVKNTNSNLRLALEHLLLNML